MIPHGIRIVLLAALFCSAPTSAHAQIGPLIDWINKMSGPQFRGLSTSATIGYRPGQFLGDSATRVLTNLSFPAEDRIEQCASRLHQAAPLFKQFPFEENAIDQMRSWIKDVLGTPSGEQGRFESDAIAQEARAAVICPLDDLRMMALEKRDPRWGFFLRLTGLAAENRIYREDEAQIFSIGLQPTAGVETRTFDVGWWRPTLAAEVGFLANYYFGDINAFWNTAFVGLISTRIFGWHEWRLLRGLRAGWGLRLHAPFRDDAFGDAYLADNLGDWEVVPTYFIGFDFTIGY